MPSFTYITNLWIQLNEHWQGVEASALRASCEPAVKPNIIRSSAKRFIVSSAHSVRLVSA